MESSPGVNERQIGSLFSLDKELQLQKHVDEIDISNGLAWTPDNSIMYYIDSVPRKVYAFDYDIHNGIVGMYLWGVFFASVMEVFAYSLNYLTLQTSCTFYAHILSILDAFYISLL